MGPFLPPKVGFAIMAEPDAVSEAAFSLARLAGDDDDAAQGSRGRGRGGFDAGRGRGSRDNRYLDMCPESVISRVKNQNMYKM